jgi:hypothetical protein
MFNLNLTLVYMIAHFFFNSASWFLMRRRMYGGLRRDDGCQVMTIAYKHFWSRWCNVSISFWRLHSIINCDNNKGQGSLMIGRSSNYCLASIDQSNSLFFFSGSRWPRWPILSLIYIVFIYIVELVLVLDIAEIQLDGHYEIINQSFNPIHDLNFF